jgi:hypothetical protein
MRVRVFFAIGLLASNAAAMASEPPESLSGLVGQEAALFVELRGLDRRWQEWSQTEFGRRWLDSSLHQLFWRSAPGQRWLSVDRQVEAVTGKRLTDQLRALFGEGVALALFLPPEGGDPQGVLIARATSPEAVERVLQSWDRLEPALRTERLPDGKGHYFRRVMKKDGVERSLFYARHAEFFALSDHEELVRDCVERWQAFVEGQTTGSLAALVDYHDVAAHWPDDAWATAFLNPRRWDAVLARDADQSPPSQRLLAMWHCVRGLGATVTVADGVHADVAAVLDAGRVPSSWREFAATSAASSMIDAAPESAVAVMGARLRPAWLFGEWEQWLSERERTEWQKGRRVLRGLLGGRDAVDDVAPQVLTDWGVAIETRKPPANTGKWWQPWSATAVSFLSPDMPRTVRDGLDNALLFGLNALAIDHNTKTEAGDWRVEPSQTEFVTRRVLHGPPEWEPVFAWTAERLVLATDAAALDRGALPAAKSNTALQATAARHFADARWFVWLDVQRLGEVARRSGVRAWPLSLALQPVAQLADEAFVSGRWTESDVRIRAAVLMAPKR